MPGTFRFAVTEDGSYSILARATALDGTGTEYAPGEGNALKQADVAGINCRVYDLGSNPDAATGTEVTPAPTLTPATNLFDTLRTVGWDAAADPYGYNFRHDLGPTYSAAPENWYQVEYKFTLVSGGVFLEVVKVKTDPAVIES